MADVSKDIELAAVEAERALADGADLAVTLRVSKRRCAREAVCRVQPHVRGCKAQEHGC